MNEHEVRLATPAEREAVLSPLMLAFASDPCMRFALSRPATFIEVFRKFATALGGAAFEHQGAWLAGDGAAAALWLPPGVHSDDEALGAIVERVGEPEKQEVLGQVGEAMPGYHPEEPHWYLAMIGVDPARRGRGLGSAILEESLRYIDEQGAVAYLEASNPKNVPLYERFGFEVTGLIQPGAFPGLVTMVRRSRS